MIKLHPSVTLERVCEAVERRRSSLDDMGICTDCGSEVDCVEPDAEGYLCDACGEDTVYGVETLLIMMA